MIYKTAIDCAKEKNNKELISILSQKRKEVKKPEQVIIDSQLETTGHHDEEIFQLKLENHQLKYEIEQLRNKINQLMTKDDGTLDKTAKLESYLLALKEKNNQIQFINLEDYEKLSMIGEGATSSVSIVIKKENEKFAMKELKDVDFKSFKRFHSEGQITFMLRHPCIIRIHGVNFGDEIHRPSIILSLQPNSLESAISKKLLDNEAKNRITVEFVLGMRYVHMRNFMHRDIKPLNILLSKKFHVRISDFGLAKELNTSTSQSKGVGTMLFMAPELFEEDDDDNGILYTNKIDVYAFGMTLIYILTEKYPKFSMRNVMKGVIPPLPDDVVTWVRDLIVRCLSSSPEERPSFAEIFETLKAQNYDLFGDGNEGMKARIERRVLKIEAFEYQQNNV